MMIVLISNLPTRQQQRFFRRSLEIDAKKIPQFGVKPIETGGSQQLCCVCTMAVTPESVNAFRSRK
jgi:hypothetical protein